MYILRSTKLIANTLSENIGLSPYRKHSEAWLTKIAEVAKTEVNVLMSVLPGWIANIFRYPLKVQNHI